ncbi:universal stress protein [Lacinutrix sp. C3R15]|uniref:universal stress protein n=1 Tax=Flavobacteriaceae TaxID=49546 RepID=UPI001C098ACF|nr:MULTISPECIES: universal stress protein [Flavobacteriaceae]MBU2938940.1 universal stress protein [Lacinutrix sp. C3R15]MDO6622253.1 universal stress protein [Oceanihabitans sp. 1_MG-2023]
MKKIIVPIDFSEHSEYALETAAVFAKKYDAEILALHMLELSNAIISNTENVQQAESVFYIKLAEKKFTEFLNKDYLKDLKITPIVKHFKVFSEVNEVAKEHNADLIIMGSQGASGFKEALIGSNTEKVVRHSNIPVLVIKENPILTDFENVVFASDFSQDAIKPYLNATKMFNGLDAKMHLVYVNLPDNRFKSSAEMEKRVADFLKAADGNIDKMKNVAYISDYSIEKGILNYSNIIGADLVAVATHGRTGLAHFFEGSVSEDIANHSTLPVMTFKI